MNYTKKFTAFLLFVAIHFCLCACGGETPPQVTTDNKPTVMFTETTAVLHPETTPEISNLKTDYDEYEPPKDPIVSIEPISKEEGGRYLFSALLSTYHFDFISDREELTEFRQKMFGGSSFVITSMEELEKFHAFLQSASDVKGASNAYGAYTEFELYGGIAPEFFNSSVLAFYIDNSCVPIANTEDSLFVSDVTLGYVNYSEDCDILCTTMQPWSQIPEAESYHIGVSCWAVSREALSGKEIWFRSPRLGVPMYEWFISPYALENMEPDDITPKLENLAEKCFVRVDDPTILPLPDGYKTYISLEGNITHKFEFEKGETIQPFFGFVKNKTDFENLLVSFEAALNLPSVDYTLEYGLFDEYDIFYVVGRGGGVENYYYTVSENTIALHLLCGEEDGIYITFFRVSKNLGDYYNIDLRFLK